MDGNGAWMGSPWMGSPWMGSPWIGKPSRFLNRNRSPGVVASEWTAPNSRPNIFDGYIAPTLLPPHPLGITNPLASPTPGIINPLASPTPGIINPLASPSVRHHHSYSTTFQLFDIILLSSKRSLTSRRQYFLASTSRLAKHGRETWP